MTRPFDLLLFDVGGVLIELGGMPTLLRWTRGAMSEEDVWHRWLTSEVVRRFETGRSSQEEFAAGVVAEFGLPVASREFLREFASWPKGPFPGALDLLASLSGSYQLATLCNTNDIFWARFEHTGLLDLFDYNFPSHEIGVLKPDAGAFRFVVDHVPASADRILFLDDNQLNVDGARSVGMVARRALGVAGARSALEAAGAVQ